MAKKMRSRDVERQVRRELRNDSSAVSDRDKRKAAGPNFSLAPRER